MRVDRLITATGYLGKGRIEALSDGVFAIAMTLLVLDLHVPTPAAVASAGGVAPALAGLWPAFLTYGVSFALLGVYWVGHHVTFHFIRQTDRNLLWINILFLMCIAFVPFSTALLAQYRNEQSVQAVYGCSVIATGLALWAHWRYATGGRRLVDPDLAPGVVADGTRRILLAPAAYLLSIGVSFVSPGASLLVFVLVPALYIFQAQIEYVWLSVRGGDKAK
jgi:uncharacterized membrane protein